MLKRLSLLLLIPVLFGLQSCEPKVSENQNQNTTIAKKTTLKATKIDAKKELELEILKIISAFESKDEKALNSYLNKDLGFYLVRGPGSLLHFEKLEKIDFSNSYIAYHQFGKPDLENYKIKYETFPTYDCENFKWDKYGVFVASKYGSILTWIIENPQNLVPGKVYTSDEIERIRKIDKITKSVIIAKKDGDISFGIAKFKNKYVITYLEIYQSYCDI